jgi:hypothetical protein
LTPTGNSSTLKNNILIPYFLNFQWKKIMMFGLKNAQTLVTLLNLFLAYFITIGPVGWFRALMAKKMGDDTAEHLGFLTLDPFVHIDFFGLAWLLLISRNGFGWGKHIPINPHNIYGPLRWLKMCCAFFSDTFAHFVLACTAFITLTLMILGNVTPANVQLLPADSFSIVLAHFLIALLWLNVVLVLVQGVVNTVIVIALYAVDGSMETESHLYYVVLFAPLIILWLFGSHLQHFVLYCIMWIQQIVAHTV